MATTALAEAEWPKLYVVGTNAGPDGKTQRHTNKGNHVLRSAWHVAGQKRKGDTSSKVPTLDMVRSVTFVD